MSGPQAIRLVGGIVPPSLLPRVQAGEVDPQSIAPASYRLAGNETIRDAAARAWSYLRGAWAAWHDMENSGAGATRDRWLLPLLRELGYGNVPALSSGLTFDGTSYPISHQWEHVPIHLLGPGASLDRRNPGVAGAARAPQAMLQEFLNREDATLWGILSNGSKLRLLRDSTALAGSAYLEFDLDAIFEGDLYAEFLLLYMLAHSTRMEKRGGSEASPGDCWLEAWRTDAVDTGTRALDRLRAGVEAALTDLGDGFLHHPANVWLVDALRNGELSDRDYLRALLRLVYRLLFTYVAEDRGALLNPEAPTAAKTTYADYFSTARLRRLSRVRAGGPHPDLWQAQRMILTALGGDGLPQLAVPPLGGLFDPDPREATVIRQPERDLLLGAELSNHAFLSAVRNLSWVEVKGGRTQPVDYRNLGAEELGSVYESLLELIPRVDLADMSFRLETTAGNDRKTSGSYYTPPGLVSALLDTALDPLLDEAVGDGKDPEAAQARLLALTVCDPACGSGGFLVAAARRIARRLAQSRSGEDEPTPEIVQHALRDVIGRCIYGVDLNDLAAELAKVSLWLEALEPGKPLGFLDARIRVGNSLLGTTPALLAAGIPDDAFKEIEGDDKKYAAAVRKQNRAERSGQSSLFAIDHTVSTVELAARRALLLTEANDVEQARDQAREWRNYEQSESYRRARLQADAWCATFMWPLASGSIEPVTEDAFQHLSTAPNDLALRAQIDEVERITRDHRFFHWHLEFPEVFGDPNSGEVGPEGWPHGFSCLLGNPPWERVKLQEQEFFAARSPEIAKAPNAAARTRLIKALQQDDPNLYQAFLDERRRAEGSSHFLRNSGRYPLTGRGDVNTYAVFAELFRTSTGPDGRSGVIVPTGIATDATTQYFFNDLVQSKSLASLYDFENAKPMFEGVHRSSKFSLLTMAGRNRREQAASFAFFLHEPGQIGEHQFALTPEEIALLNPNTGTCPVFRTRRDAEITLGIYRRVPVLINEAKVAAGDPDGNPWDVSFSRMFDMSNDSHLFRTREDLEADSWTLVGNTFERDAEKMLPLYQGIMFGPYDHRACDVVRSATAEKRQNQPRYISEDEKEDAERLAMPIYWIPAEAVDTALGGFNARWFAGVRKVTSATNERTAVVGSFPRAGLGDSANLLISDRNLAVVVSSLASFAADFVLRQKLGGLNLNFFILEQLPVPNPKRLDPADPQKGRFTSEWIHHRALELTYSAWDMAPFAEDLGDVDASGRVNPPFVWDDERRFLLRCELDAAFFHLYGLDRDEVFYIMDTFPIVRRKDEAAHGEYRTKRVILEVYDAIGKAIATGIPYETPISPPPGQGPRHAQRSES